MLYPFFKSLDFPIKTNDIIEIAIPAYLTVFSSHNIQLIKSINDIEKAKILDFEEAEGISLQAIVNFHISYKQDLGNVPLRA